jgi:type III restriction enzyme
MSRAAAPKAAPERQFFDLLTEFYRQHRKAIRRDYPQVLRAFLDHNDPRVTSRQASARRGAEPLRVAQFEALEIYVFLKQAAGSAPVYELFDQWYEARPGTVFERREARGFDTDRHAQQAILFREDQRVTAAWRELRARMQRVAEDRAAEEGAATKGKAPAPVTPSYIFALSMGVGKTRLMGLCILYEFLMARRFPTDERYAHNAIVFAPDTTVREALREIEGMDFAAYLQESERGGLPVEIKTRVLDDDVTSLQLHDGGDFHIVISNVQKILVKQQHKAKPAAAKLLSQPQLPLSTPTGAFAAADELELLEDDKDLVFNQRFKKLLRAPNLGIYIDEAHHAFGAEMAVNIGDVAGKAKETAFRRTVRLLNAKLRAAGSRVVGTFCFTGTPYAEGKVLSEVVFAYSLAQAIGDQILKRCRLDSYANVKDQGFIDDVINDFAAKVGPLGASAGRRYEGMLPKLAIFAAGIEEARDELRPMVEAAVARHGLSASAVLVNTSEASADEERAFRRLDTPESEHQVVILVGKGKEGWNCRSLFGVALFRNPHSRVFVLQATMRCLRSIEAPIQHTGNVYLSEANRKILEEELLANFQLSLNGLQSAGRERGSARPVRVNPPPVKITLRRVRMNWELFERKSESPASVGLGRLDPDWVERYHVTKTVVDNALTLSPSKMIVEDITARAQTAAWNDYQLVAECARYLNRSPLEIERVLQGSVEGLDLIVTRVNQYNDLVWDALIPNLFSYFFELRPKIEKENVEEVFLTPGYRHEDGREMREKVEFLFQASEHLVVGPGNKELAQLKGKMPKTFHVDPYCFDSGSELKAFLALVQEKGVREVYFTGMFTSGQAEFVLRYIDPEAKTVRSYYPDFVVHTDGGGWVLLEVKADNQLLDPVVRAKAEAGREAAATQNNMRYALLPSTLADAGFAGLALDPANVGEDSVVRAKGGVQGVLG